MISKEVKRGPHAFRRTRITEVINNTGGNVVLAAQMFGNSPETIRKNYYTKDTIKKQLEALNQRKNILNESVTTVTTKPVRLIVYHHLATTYFFNKTYAESYYFFNNFRHMVTRRVWDSNSCTLPRMLIL